MNIKKIVAGMAAGVVAASAMAVTAFADEEIKYYIWGGQQVGWAMDLDNDDTNNVEGSTEGNQFPGYGKDGYEEFWIGDLDSAEGTATLKIPVVKGAKVDFIAGGWGTYDGDQYDVTIGDWKATIKWIPIEGDPDHSDVGATYEVTDDVTELTAEIYYKDPVDDGNTFGFNDYCQNFVHVHLPDGAAAPAESKAEEASSAAEESKAEEASSAAEESKAEEASSAAEESKAEAASSAAESKADDSSSKAEESSKAPLIIGICAGVVVVAGCVIFFLKKR